MKARKIKYKIGTATESDVFIHLEKCSNIFVPILSKRVDLSKYAKKIYKKSVTFEAWREEMLIGVVAAYFNDSRNSSAFITNVSVLIEYSRQGIALALLSMCVEHARKNKFDMLMLEVHKKNHLATRFYKKNEFEVYGFKENTYLMKRIVQ